MRLRASRALRLSRLALEWSSCERCPLGAKARNHALWDLPWVDRADVLFVGEGPGVVEDVRGVPFRGPAGKLLRECIEAANPGGISYGLTNLLACRPHGGKPSDGENRPPAFYEVDACRPRLLAMLRILEPKAVVSCGREPEAFMPEVILRSGIDTVHRPVRHPAWVIRQPDVDTAKRRYVSSLREIFEEVRGETVGSTGGDPRYFYHPESDCAFTLPDDDGEILKLYETGDGALCVEITQEEYEEHHANNP